MNRFDEKAPENIYKYVKYRRVTPNRKLLVIAIGGIIGILFFYITGGRGVSLDEEFWSSSLGRIASVGTFPDVFQYIFALRIKQLLFLIVCSYSYLGNVLAYGILGGFGFEFSLIFLTFVYNYKFRGILLSVIMIVPQWIFYSLLVLLIFEKYYYNDKNSVYKGKIVALWKIIMAIVLFLLGFLCESCVNYELMQVFMSSFCELFIFLLKNV